MLAPYQLSESKQTLLTELTQGLEPHALHWLSGYLAGVAQNRQPALALAPAPTSLAADSATDSARQLTIIYGSQTGNAKRVAEKLAERAHALGLATRLIRADRYPTRELKDEHLLYIVISTQGEGDPPDDSMALVEFLNSRRAPKLEQLNYAVLGLGDSSYPEFCGIAYALDKRLAELGAKQLHDTGAADLDLETVVDPWQEAVIPLAQKFLKRPETPSASVTALRPATPAVSRDQPFLAELLQNQKITGRDSDKDVRHLEISLEGSSLRYQPGDALGVWPVQSPLLVQEIISVLELDPEEEVTISSVSRPLHTWLSQHRELTQLTRPFLLAHSALANQPALHTLLLPESQPALKTYLETRQLLDVLQEFPAAWTAAAFVKALRPLTPRMYSIASSQALVDEEVHLTLANVAYDYQGHSRWGVTSRFLADLSEGDKLPIFIEENTRFRLPQDRARDLIMIGPGTGIAPFRAFVQERSAKPGSGRQWLFFGNPHFSSDFLYQTEWQQALEDGQLDRLSVAFSRDQPEKVYVQHKLLEHAAELYDWVQSGAYIYVCGDATRMAQDVHQALLTIAQDQGGLDSDQAKQWLGDLAAQGRYARDVY